MKITKNLKLFKVHVPANVYTGKYFDFQTAPVNVAARNAPEAIKILNANKPIVLFHISRMRSSYNGQNFRNRRLIPRTNPEKNVFFRSSYSATQGYGPYGIFYATTLFKDGTFRQVHMERGGRITSVQQS